MSTATIPAAFTLSRYRAYLELALENGYRFGGFDRSLANNQRVIYLRHDIDFSPRFMTAMADLEAELGIRSTFFVQLSCPWYRVETPDNRAAIELALSRGHRLGLHFDATGIDSDDGLPDRVAADAALLGEQFGIPVRAISFHNARWRPVAHIALPPPLVHTYCPAFFRDIGYVSDSNQNWRGKDLRGILMHREYRRFQLLIHPFWWRAEPLTLGAKLRAFADEVGISLEELAAPEHIEIMRSENAASS